MGSGGSGRTGGKGTTTRGVRVGGTLGDTLESPFLFGRSFRDRYTKDEIGHSNDSTRRTLTAPRAARTLLFVL